MIADLKRARHPRATARSRSSTIDTAISDAGRPRREARARARPPTPSSGRRSRRGRRSSVELSGSFLLFMVLAALIAAVGIYQDSADPDRRRDGRRPGVRPDRRALRRARRSARAALALRSRVALAVGFPLAIGAALVATLIFKATGVTPDDLRPADHSLADVIASPDFLAFFVAFCAGTAGMLSLTTAKSGALIGVLISVTTIPAAANIGVTRRLRRLGRAAAARPAQLGDQHRGDPRSRARSRWRAARALRAPAPPAPCASRGRGGAAQRRAERWTRCRPSCGSSRRRRR